MRRPVAQEREKRSASAAAGEQGRPSAANATAHASSLAALKKLRARPPSSSTPWVVRGAALAAVALAAGSALRWRREPRAEESRYYQEALKVLRNDGLEPTTQNVGLAVRLVEIARDSYSDADFRVVDSRLWSSQCTEERPAPCVLRPNASAAVVASDGRRLAKVELQRGDANAWLVEDFVSEEEAAALVARIQELNFSTSPTSRAEAQEWRSSSSALVPAGDPAFAPVVRRSAALCGVPASFIETPQVVRYQPGESYRPHLDSEGAAHRHWTVLLYLGDPEAGGATTFPLLRLKVLPAPRAALMWENLRDEPGVGKVRNYFALHAGQPPAGSRPKYAVNIWVRNKPYVPVP